MTAWGSRDGVPTRRAARRRLPSHHHRALSGILQVPASAGFSVWADLSSWLAVPTFAAEQALWRAIWKLTRVNILPGAAFGCPQPGWFRLCHATDRAVVREGITRIGRQLASLEPRCRLDPVPTPRAALEL